MANELTAETNNQDFPATSGACPNCHAELRGTWCYSCGQSQKPIDRFFFSLVSEAFEDVFSWDSRAAKTVFALLFRPGFLTTEYFAGRRARYVPPLRLYLIASLLFFFLLSLQNMAESRATAQVDSDGFRLQFEGKPQNDPVTGTDTATEKSTAEISAAAKKAVTERLAIAKKELTVTSEQIPAEVAAEINAALDQVGASHNSGTITKDSENRVQEMNAEYDKIDFKWLSKDSNDAIRDRLKAQTLKVDKLNKEDPGALLDALIDVAPPVMFILLPLFAFLLKLTYLGSGRYYTEHLVLAVHNHSFLYLILIVDGATNYGADRFALFEYLRIAALTWIPLYMFLSLKRVYREGYFLTFFKYCFLGISYIIIFTAAVMLAFLIGVMTL